MIIASGGVEDRPRTPEEKGKNPAAAATARPDRSESGFPRHAGGASL